MLAVEITRDGFEWALSRSCLSSFEPETYASRREWEERKRTSPLRVQWDPERSLTLAPLEQRAVQVGLAGEAVHRYLDEWIVGLSDITATVRAIATTVEAGDLESARTQLPAEAPYPLSHDLAVTIGASE